MTIFWDINFREAIKGIFENTLDDLFDKRELVMQCRIIKKKFVFKNQQTLARWIFANERFQKFLQDKLCLQFLCLKFQTFLMMYH